MFFVCGKLTTTQLMKLSQPDVGTNSTESLCNHKVAILELGKVGEEMRAQHTHTLLQH
jgi:hypothetical protein